MTNTLFKPEPVDAADYFEGWVADAITPQRKFLTTHSTENGHVHRDWRNLVPGDSSINNLQTAAMAIVEMCEHYQVTSKDSEAREALHRDVAAEQYTIGVWLDKLKEMT